MRKVRDLSLLARELEFVEWKSLDKMGHKNFVESNPIPNIMAIPVVETSREGYKIRKVFG